MARRNGRSKVTTAELVADYLDRLRRRGDAGPGYQWAHSWLADGRMEAVEQDELVSVQTVR